MCSIWDCNSIFVNHLHFVKNDKENKALSFLYNNYVGTLFQKILIQRKISELMGKYYDSSLSKKIIPNYIKKNNIDMKEYKEKKYNSFNDFFTREKKKIEFSKNKNFFCSPCDGFLSAYKITENQKFLIKGQEYTLEELLLNQTFAKKYADGMIYIFRLMPNNYHRYHYFDDGKFLMGKKINGYFHTVRPVALKKKKVFLENQREYSVLATQNFKDIVYMEVGALAVGKIKNHSKMKFKKGEEKGMFLFGGSTIIILFEKNVLKEDPKLLKNSLEGYEAVVKCGYIVGEKK